MGLLDQLMGGGQDPQGYGDFVRRYEDGPPDTGYDDDEAYDRHEQVSRHLSRQEYEHSAREAFSRMTPQQRRQLGRQLQERVPDFDQDNDGREDRYEDPGTLAGLFAGARDRQPDVLGQMMGGRRGGRSVRGDRDRDGIPDRMERQGGGRDRDRDGIPDRMERQQDEGGLGDMLGGGGGGDTLMKVALGGIAAMAVKQVMDRR